MDLATPEARRRDRRGMSQHRTHRGARVPLSCTRAFGSIEGSVIGMPWLGRVASRLLLACGCPSHELSCLCTPQEIRHVTSGTTSAPAAPLLHAGMHLLEAAGPGRSILAA